MLGMVEETSLIVGRKGAFVVVVEIPCLRPPFYTLSNERALSAEMTKKPFRFVSVHVCDLLVLVYKKMRKIVLPEYLPSEIGISAFQPLLSDATHYTFLSKHSNI